MKKIFLKNLVFTSFVLLTFIILSSTVSAQSMFRKVLDFDGDGKTDYVVVRNENNLMVWYIWQSSAGLKVFQWGLWTDTPTAGDYDGDGKTDIAVYRGAVTTPQGLYNVFYIFQSGTNSILHKTFQAGPMAEIPFHQDYDGDGKTDPAILFTEIGMNRNISIQQSSTNTLRSASFPSGNYGIRLGDLDGDGRADMTFAPYNSNLVTSVNLQNNAVKTQQFGIAGDVYIPADFDGDGIGDFAVWRETEGNWYWLKSFDGTFRGEHWGSTGDVPVPGDYDGDGKTDLAVWRPGMPNSTYYTKGSQNGVRIFIWGLFNDKAIRY